MMALMELFWGIPKLVLLRALREELFGLFSSRAGGSFPRATSEARLAAWSDGRLETSDAMASGDEDY